MLLVYGLMTATVNSMDGLWLFLLYIDIIPFNPYSLTAILINLYNHHYTTAITYLKPHLDPKSAIGSSFLYI